MFFFLVIHSQYELHQKQLHLYLYLYALLIKMRIKLKFYNDWGNLEVRELNVTSKGTVEDLIYEI